MTQTIEEVRPPIKRALEDRARDTRLAEEAATAGDVVALRKMCERLVDEREKLAKGMDATIQGYALLREDSPLAGTEHNAVEAVERIAHEAIDFAREVLRLVYREPPPPTVPRKR